MSLCDIEREVRGRARRRARQDLEGWQQRINEGHGDRDAASATSSGRRACVANQRGEPVWQTSEESEAGAR